MIKVFNIETNQNWLWLIFFEINEFLDDRQVPEEQSQPTFEQKKRWKKLKIFMLDYQGFQLF